MLTRYGQREWITIILLGTLLTAAAIYLHWWILAVLLVLFALALLSFFRDPPRVIPTLKGIMVSPADGRISSIHEVESYEPFGGVPATCIRIFLSVADVHVNRSPCHGEVLSITPKPGEYLNALNPRSAEVNESNLVVMVHPIRRHPVAAVRQVSGLIARRIVCDTKVGQTLQRGQRFGMIKFGSTAELYIPKSFKPDVAVRLGQYVWGGKTVLVKVTTPAGSESDEPITATAKA
ncbi:MAG: phosphatidylserine decarboxylase [Planctomycetes bacterium]|nr:phosphatidylserine decarboxylase [Planctomycetota bacterium]